MALEVTYTAQEGVAVWPSRRGTTGVGPSPALTSLEEDSLDYGGNYLR
jgi:hypothetical protein